MYYKNNSQKAILELERQRTGNYGMDDGYDDYHSVVCDECEKGGEILFDVNSHIICAGCICDILREEFALVSELMKNTDIDCTTIFNEIISDFSDNELLCYVESIYQKVEG